MRASTLLLTCITAILVVGAVALVLLPTMAELHRALTATLSIAR
ncbi:hypothetical protein [Cupriavidus sp. SK-4]|nr:hypothetical protein [Cupriavidus sp. SK-4]